MNRDDIIRMAKEAGFNQILATNAGADVWIDDGFYVEELERFAALVVAEKEQQMIRDGWRQCAEGQRTTQFCGLLDAAVKAEREACAKVCEARVIGDHNREDQEAKRCAAAIRARNEQEQPR